MSYIEKEKLIKADIASIENRVRHAFNQGYDLGFKDGKKRAKPLDQEPTIKALGEELRKARKGIADEKVLIGYNLAVAICNKHLGESEE
jgi:hypothetical protein